MSETIIKVENVSKQYRLGAIGGTTLRDDLQRLGAKIRGKEDPTLKIGQAVAGKNERFLALDDISFEVKKGEALGIIGHNGAGKSTLLKLLSRVTAPTKGTISYNGRITSMLEVGTGFHGELTGRENVYMNGAILGMKKAEIDKKMNDIIAFAEMEQFIDTPVKRYSSGMYVKLAFSVAAHLDSEIMIMDEVLAVGDINFQQKCLQRMRQAATEEGRTVLYVSHNMKTIQQLCSRCIVLNHGKIAYSGSVDEAIAVYSKKNDLSLKKEYIVSGTKRTVEITNDCHVNRITIKNNELDLNESLVFLLNITSNVNIFNALVRFVLFDNLGNAIGASYSDYFNLKSGDNSITLRFDSNGITAGKYSADIIISQFVNGIQIRHDIVTKALAFSINETEIYYNMKWNKSGWGTIKFSNISVEDHNG